MRRLIGCACILAVAACGGYTLFHSGLVEWSGDSLSSSAGPSLPVGEPFAAPVRGDDSVFDLDFTSGSRYVVVIGSLGPSARRFDVDCRSESIPFLQSLPQQRVSPPVLASSFPVSAAPLDEAGPAGSQPQVNKPQPAAERTFALHVTDGSLDDPAQYVKVRARPIAEGREVRVYLDKQQSPRNLPPALIKNVTELFDEDIIPRFRGSMGVYRDVDGDGRFSVLLSPWLAQLQGGRTSIGGFVRGSDFQSRLGPPFSNRCDMMYVNSQTLPGPHLRTLLIHEYAHAVCFSRRTADRRGQPRFPDEEDWLNEAIAHCAETLFDGGWSNLDYRIARFLSEPSAFPLVVDDYYRAGLWRCHGCRGGTYLFLRYCVERFGAETLGRLIANPARGTRNLEEATGCRFERLFRGWTLSLLDSGRTGAPGRTKTVLAPLDLYGPLGCWGLAGPRRTSWNVDAGPLRVSLRGTSAAYVELHAAGAGRSRRIHLAAPRGTRMQVSVVRLPAECPRIELAASWGDAAQTAGGPLRVVVRGAGSPPAAIEHLSAEQNSGESRGAVSLSGESLAEIERTSSASAAPGQRVFDIPSSRFTSGDVPVIVKAVVSDGQGRRSAAWATLPARKQPPQPQRIAVRRP